VYFELLGYPVTLVCLPVAGYLVENINVLFSIILLHLILIAPAFSSVHIN